jgi:hypothetical protein
MIENAHEPTGQIQLLGIAVTLIVGISGIISSWLLDLTQSSQRRGILEDSAKRLEFWKSWVQCTSALEPLSAEQTKRARIEFERCSLVVADAYRHWPNPNIRTPEEFKDYISKISWLRRLAMFYKSPQGNFYSARLAVYLGVLMPIALWTLGSVVFFFKPGHPRPDHYVEPWLIAEFMTTACIFRGLQFREERRFLSKAKDFMLSKKETTSSIVPAQTSKKEQVDR